MPATGFEPATLGLKARPELRRTPPQASCYSILRISPPPGTWRYLGLTIRNGYISEGLERSPRVREREMERPRSPPLRRATALRGRRGSSPPRPTTHRWLLKGLGTRSIRWKQTQLGPSYEQTPSRPGWRSQARTEPGLPATWAGHVLWLVPNNLRAGRKSPQAANRPIANPQRRQKPCGCYGVQERGRQCSQLRGSP